MGAGLSVGLVVGCIEFDPFACQNDADCVFDGLQGQCRLAEQTCIYPDQACPTQWSTAQGECMSPIGMGPGSSGGSDGASGVVPGTDDVDDADGSTGATTLPPTTGMVTTTSATTGPPPTTTTNTTASTGEPAGCGPGPFNDVTGLGVVWASSTFSDSFQDFLSVDGNYGTSWFSDGPEPMGPSIYRWEVLDPVCITSINIVGNGLHQNPSFRTEYGFGSVVVRVYDEADAIVFQQMEMLDGTPDPPVLVEPEVWGVRVELELSQHESDDCGGFSELEIVGL